MRSFFAYLIVWITGIVLFTISYTIYLRENDLPVRYEHEIPNEVRYPVYIFAFVFLIFLVLFKLLLSTINTKTPVKKKKK